MPTDTGGTSTSLDYLSQDHHKTRNTHLLLGPCHQGAPGFEPVQASTRYPSKYNPGSKLPFSTSRKETDSDNMVGPYLTAGLKSKETLNLKLPCFGKKSLFNPFLLSLLHALSLSLSLLWLCDNLALTSICIHFKA